MKLRSRLGKNILWLIGSRFGSQGMMVLFTILLARRLGSAGFGEYAFISAAVFLGNTLTTFGTDMLLIREIASRDDQSTLPVALLIQLVLSLLFILATFIAAPLLPNQSPAAVLGLKIYSLALLPLAFFTVFTTALRGKQRMDAYMALNLSVASLQVIVVWLFIAAGIDIVRVAVLLLIIQFVAAFLAGIICTTHIPGFWRTWRFSAQSVPAVMRASAPIALLALVGMLYQKLPVYMLSTLAGAAVTGWFSAGLRTVEASKTIHLAVFTALYPAMAEASFARDDAEELLPWSGSFGLSWKLLLAGAGAAALVLTLFADPITRLLYGAEFAESVLALKILAWTLIPFTVNNFLSLANLAVRRERIVIRVQLVGLLIMFGLDAWWVPQWGLTGACLASLLAESAQAAAYIYPRKYLPRTVIKLFGAAG